MTDVNTIAAKYMARVQDDTTPWRGTTDAARLAQAADCFGMTPDGVAEFADLLAAFNLKSVDDQLLREAQRLARQWHSHVHGIIDDRWGRPNETTKPTKKKREKKDPQPSKPKVERDRFGSREGSASHELNATVLEGGATSAEDMSELSGVAIGRCKAHVKWLVDRDFITGGAESFTVNGEAVPAKQRKRKTRVKYQIWDINACSIIRWMGANGWDFDDAAIAIETLGCQGMSTATMKLHHTAGRKGDTRWGEPATLTTYQKRALRNAAE